MLFLSGGASKRLTTVIERSPPFPPLLNLPLKEKEKSKKRLTSRASRGSILPALSGAQRRNARVVELADSLDSGSSVHYARAGSSPASCTKKKDICFQQMSFFLGSGRRRRPSPFGIKMLSGSKFRLRQGFRLRRKRLYGAKAPPARRPVG